MNDKPTYNPNIHHRRSIRLKGYDYSQAGLYFITICVQDREHLFGEITNGKMNLNDAGKMVEKWYYELENKFPDIKCHAMVVMPNHFHCIIQNVGANADPRVCPPATPVPPIDNAPTIELGQSGMIDADILGEHDIAGEHNILGEHDIAGEHNILGEHVGSPLRGVVQWFKTMTTNEYIRGVKTLNWQRFNGKLWQRNYYEHIIRDEHSYHTISKYITNNPAKWPDDKFHTT